VFVPSLLRHPLARLITVTAAIGSLADWVLFATLVVTVDRLIGGGPWATAIVLLVKILPGVVFAPLAARRTDGADLRTSLVRHEVLRVGAVVTLAAAFATSLVPLVLVALLALEFAAAMQAAARESTISRHVPRRLFTGLNTATAVLAFGLLPVGPVVVDLVGATSGWVLAITAYAALALTYGLLLRLEEAPAGRADPVAAASVAPGPTPSSAPPPTSWVRVTLAAALGILPAVALFTLGPSFAHAWVGDRSATGPLYAAVLAGGAAGFVLANRASFRADVAMAVASGGLVLAATGWWVPGLVLLGLGAGGAYLDLQTRLQHAATDPSQFAASFA
jgi:MFS family permease